MGDISTEIRDISGDGTGVGLSREDIVRLDQLQKRKNQLTREMQTRSNALFARMMGDVLAAAEAWAKAKTVHVDESEEERLLRERKRRLGLGVSSSSDSALDGRLQLMQALLHRLDLAVRAFSRSLRVFTQENGIYQAVKRVQQAWGTEPEAMPVMLVSGRPGSGKSTQLPQVLAQRGLAQAKNGCRLLVTEPQPESAALLAYRVAQELGSKVGAGGAVGLAIAGSQPLVSRSNSIVFVDEATALIMAGNWLQQGGGSSCADPDPGAAADASAGGVAQMMRLESFGIIMVDEVHERGVQCDALLGMVKRIMYGAPGKSGGSSPSCTYRPTLLVASATLDHDEIEAFFPGSSRFQIDGFSYDTKTQFEQLDAVSRQVDDFYRERKSASRLSILGPRGLQRQKPPHTMGKPNARPTWRYRRPKIKDQIETLVQCTALVAFREAMGLVQRKASEGVLAFAPGRGAAYRCKQAMLGMLQEQFGHTRSVQVLVLDSGSLEKSMRASNTGTPVVYFATRVAESSITVPGVSCVIDCGYDWQEVYDPDLRISQRRLERISQAAAIQREGRTGRTCPGKCIRLYSKDSFDVMRPQNLPGVLRCDVTRMTLGILTAGISTSEFQWITRPRVHDQLAAVHTLCGLGLAKKDGGRKGQASVSSATFRGHVVQSAGMEPWHGALLFKAIEATGELAIGSQIVLRLVALLQSGLQGSLYRSITSRLQGATSPWGDLITLLRVYTAWERLGLVDAPAARPRSGSRTAEEIREPERYNELQAELVHLLFSEAAERVIDTFKGIPDRMDQIADDVLKCSSLEFGSPAMLTLRPLGEAGISALRPAAPQAAIGAGADESKTPEDDEVDGDTDGASAARLIELCVEPLDVAFEVEHPATSGSADLSIERMVACFVGWALQDNLAASNSGARAGYSLQRHGRWIGIAQIHNSSCLSRAVDGQAMPDIVAFEQVQDLGSYIMCSLTRVVKEDLIRLAGMRSEDFPAGVDMAAVEVEGMDTATYRSMLGAQCTQIKRITMHPGLPLGDHQALLQTPWTSGHGSVPLGSLRLWVPAGRETACAAWLKAQVTAHHDMQMHAVDVVPSGNQDHFGGDGSLLVGPGARVLRAIAAPRGYSHFEDRGTGPSSGAGRNESDVEAAGAECENIQVLVTSVAKPPKTADGSNDASAVHRQKRIVPMDWMALLQAFRDRCMSAGSPGYALRAGNDMYSTDPVMQRLVPSYRELDSPFSIRCRAVFTAVSPAAARVFRQFVLDHSKAGGVGASAGGSAGDVTGDSASPANSTIDADVIAPMHLGLDSGGATAVGSTTGSSTRVLLSWLGKPHDGACTIRLSVHALSALPIILARPLAVRPVSGIDLGYSVQFEYIGGHAVHAWGFPRTMHPLDMATTIDQAIRAQCPQAASCEMDLVMELVLHFGEVPQSAKDLATMDDGERISIDAVARAPATVLPPAMHVVQATRMGKAPLYSIKLGSTTVARALLRLLEISVGEHRFLVIPNKKDTTGLQVVMKPAWRVQDPSELAPPEIIRNAAEVALQRILGVPQRPQQSAATESAGSAAQHISSLKRLGKQLAFRVDFTSLEVAARFIPSAAQPSRIVGPFKFTFFGNRPPKGDHQKRTMVVTPPAKYTKYSDADVRRQLEDFVSSCVGAATSRSAKPTKIPVRNAYKLPARSGAGAAGATKSTGSAHLESNNELLMDFVRLESILSSAGGVVGEPEWGHPDDSTGISTVEVMLRDATSAGQLVLSARSSNLQLSSMLPGSQLRAQAFHLLAGNVDTKASNNAHYVLCTLLKSDREADPVPLALFRQLPGLARQGHFSAWFRTPLVLKGNDQAGQTQLCAVTQSAQGLDRVAARIKSATEGIDVARLLSTSSSLRMQQVIQKVQGGAMTQQLQAIGKKHKVFVVEDKRRGAGVGGPESARRCGLAAIGLRDNLLLFTAEAIEAVRTAPDPYRAVVTEGELPARAAAQLRSISRAHPLALVSQIENRDPARFVLGQKSIWQAKRHPDTSRQRPGGAPAAPAALALADALAAAPDVSGIRVQIIRDRGTLSVAFTDRDRGHVERARAALLELLLKQAAAQAAGTSGGSADESDQEMCAISYESVGKQDMRLIVFGDGTTTPNVFVSSLARGSSASEGTGAAAAAVLGTRAGLNDMALKVLANQVGVHVQELDTATKVAVEVPGFEGRFQGKPIPLGVLVDCIGPSSVGQCAARVLAAATNDKTAYLPLGLIQDIGDGDGGGDPSGGAFGAAHASAAGPSRDDSEERLAAQTAVQSFCQRLLRCPVDGCDCVSILPPLACCEDGRAHGQIKPHEGRCMKKGCPAASWCLKCGSFGDKLHVGPCTTAELWQRHQELSKATDEARQTNNLDIRQCANPDCSKPIWRFSGCNHMTCMDCHTHFCWLCGFPWAKGSTGGPIYDHQGECSRKADWHHRSAAELLALRASAGAQLLRKRIRLQPSPTLGEAKQEE